MHSKRVRRGSESNGGRGDGGGGWVEGELKVLSTTEGGGVDSSAGGELEER